MSDSSDLEKSSSREKRKHETDDDSSSCSDDSGQRSKIKKKSSKKKKDKKHDKRKGKKKKRDKDREKVKKRKCKKHSKKETEEKDDDIGPILPPDFADSSRNFAPMSKEQWEAKQSEVKRVLDEESGRYRLIKGDGEVIEEIVSRDRHKEINKQATKGDGAYFQTVLGNKKV